MPSSPDQRSSLILVTLFALVPLIGAIFPRAISFLPGIVALLACLITFYQTRQWPPFQKSPLLWSLAIVGLIGLSSLWAIDREMTWDRLVKTAPIFLGAILLTSWIPALGDSARQKFHTILRVISIITGLFILFEFLTGGWIVQHLHDTERFGGTSYMNRTIVIYFFCSLPLFIISKWQRLDYCAGALLFLVVMMSDSQSSQLALIIFAAIRWWLPLRSKMPWLVTAVALTIITLGAVPMAIFLYEHCAAALDGRQWFSEAYATERMEIWDFVARKTLEKPFLGFGIEATRLLGDFDSKNIYRVTSDVLHPHNFALQIWIEFGALGAVMAIALIIHILYSIHRSFLKSETTGRFYLAVFLALISVALTTYGIWQGWWLGLFTYILGSCMIVAESREGPQETK